MKNKIKIFVFTLLMSATIFSTNVISFASIGSNITENYIGSDPAIPNENIPIYGQEGPIARTVYATTTSNVNFRSKASMVEGEIYYQISKGVLLEIIDSTTEVSWCKVRHSAAGKSTTGYVHKDYLKF